MKLDVIFTANRRTAKKAAAKVSRGLFAYPLDKQNFGLVKCYKGTITIIKRDGAPLPHHWSSLEGGWNQ